MPDWESILNYEKCAVLGQRLRETRWMTRTDIVDATYDAAGLLNDLKRRYGRITEVCAAGVSKRLGKAREIRRKLLANGELDSDEVRAFSEGTINDKAELFAPGAFLRNFRISGIVRLLARQLFTRRPTDTDLHHAVSESRGCAVSGRW